MIEKIKTNALAILAAVVAVLAALLFRQSKKTAQVEGELAGAQAENRIQGVDHDREIAKIHADELVDDYARKRAEYDENKLGGGT